MNRTSLLQLALLPLLCSLALAQAPGAPPMPPQTNGAPQHGGMDFHGRGGRDSGRDAERGPEHDRSFEHGGMMGLPPGTWWKNPDIAAKLSLTADQQARMDDILRQNRLQLVDMKASLEKEQINLEPLLNANPVDTNKAMAEIAKIADQRAGLEKANAKMLLGLRSVLTADQWTKLHTRPERGAAPANAPGGPGQRGPSGPRGPGGPPPAGGGSDLF